jgi:hypothetical protein
MVEWHDDQEKVNTVATIPDEYHQLAKVFSEQEACCFSSSREWDHISLKPDAYKTIHAKIYTLSKLGKDAIEEWVYKMLDKGFIQLLDSPYGHTTFMIPTKDGIIQIVQDF